MSSLIKKMEKQMSDCDHVVRGENRASWSSFSREFKKNYLGLPSALLVFYAVPVTMCISVSEGIMANIFTNCSLLEEKNNVKVYTPSIAQWLQGGVIYILHPIVGWLADTKLGRDKSISCSLWFCWCGIVLHIVSYCFIYEKCDWTDWLYIVGTVLSIPALMLLIIGVACYQSCMLAYGLDQLPDASSNQVKKFIRWLTWCMFVGLCFKYMQFFPLTDNIILATSFLIFIIMSIALVLHGSFKHRFYPSGTVKHNPYSTVIRILKYAFKHKSPEDRSSLTYWEEHTPSRIDLAKNKYGGPFTESDVEDIKTFWRMVAIFCSLGGLFIPYFSTVTQGAYYSLQFQVGYFFTSNYIPFVIWQVFYLLGLLYLPVTELLILPLFPKFEYFLQLITSLKGIGIAIVSLSLALIVILLLEAYGISGINDNDILPCYIRMDSIIYKDENYYHNISFAYFIIPWFFIGIAYFLTTLKSFQFICSQAPNEMCGLLTGVFWFIRSVYICIGAIITYFLTLLVSDNRFTCTFWTILVNLPICFIFSIIFALLARWYNQKQKREESFHVQSVVERYYDKFLSSDYIKEGNNKKFNKYDLPINGWSDETIPIFTNRK